MSSETTKKPEPQDDQPAGGKPGDDRVVEEIGGPQGPEPTRFGDWEKAGRCTDF